MPNRYMLGAQVDIGNEREKQEDYVQFLELDDNNLLCVIADGTGSTGRFQPAAIVTESIKEQIEFIFNKDKKLFKQQPELFLEMAMRNANKLLGGFKLGNEELYSGYAASVTCLLCSENNRIYFAHAGNTRLSLIRDGNIINLTNDHTAAFELLENGEITEEQYYLHPGNLELTSGIGVLLDPEIQTERGKIKETDILLLTTDGVHYSIQQRFIPIIVLESDDVNSAASSLVSAAKGTKTFFDNISAAVICLAPIGEEE